MDPHKIYVVLHSHWDDIVASKSCRLSKDNPADVAVRVLLDSKPTHYKLHRPTGPVFELYDAYHNRSSLRTKCGLEFDLGICSSLNVKVSHQGVEWLVSNPVDYGHSVRRDAVVLMSKQYVLQNMF